MRAAARLSLAASVHIAAPCTTAIIGIATKFNARPATVIREKNSALTGINASSAQAVAMKSARAAWRPDWATRATNGIACRRARSARARWGALKK